MSNDFVYPITPIKGSCFRGKILKINESHALHENFYLRYGVSFASVIYQNEKEKYFYRGDKVVLHDIVGIHEFS